MKRETIEFKDESEWLALRGRDVTSTDIAALFNVSPYSTPYRLWHTKKGGVLSQFVDTERVRWGTRMENVIANGIAEDHGFKCEPFKVYMRLPEYNIGSSFDHVINGNAIFEIKNVSEQAFSKVWHNDGGSIVAPPHIELQVQHQMLVAGMNTAYIGLCVGGNRSYLTRRELDAGIAKEILERSKQFWYMVEKGMEPAPDFAKDCGSIVELYKDVKDDKVIMAPSEAEDLATRYANLGIEQARIEKERAAVKAQLLLTMKDAQKMIGSNFNISSKVIPETEISYTRKQYRTFNVRLSTKE